MKKNGDVRICVDLRQLNRLVKREKYMLPTLEDVTSKLRGCKVFWMLLVVIIRFLWKKKVQNILPL